MRKENELKGAPTMYNENEIFSKLGQYEEEMLEEDARDREMFPYLFDEKGVNWLSLIPTGWVPLAREFFMTLNEVFRHYKNLYPDFNFKVLDLKEKYGRLCMYYTVGLEEEDTRTFNDVCQTIDNFLYDWNKAHFTKTCVNCGGRNKKLSYILDMPLCEDCWVEMHSRTQKEN